MNKLLFFVIVGLSFYCLPSFAFLVPSFYITRNLARQHNKIVYPALFKSRVQFYNKNKYLGTFTEQLYFSDPQNLSVRLVSENANQVVLRSRTIDSGSPVLYHLLWTQGEANLFETFKSLGIPLKSEHELYSEKEGNLAYKPEDYSSFYRFEGKISQVFSTKILPQNIRDESKVASPQLWVEKDTLSPFRYIAQYSSGDVFEYRLSGYQVNKNFNYPKQVQIFKNRQMIVKIDSIDFFPQSKEKPDLTTNSEGLSGELSEAVEQYYRWVR